jgi:hypothetical protein
MWLGQRSSPVRHRVGHKLILMAICGLAAPSALAQTGNQTATVGPGRIICNATFCELGAGPPGRQRIRVIVAALPKADTARLRKCTGVAPPCVVTVNGTTEENASRILATEIYWQD